MMTANAARPVSVTYMWVNALAFGLAVLVWWLYHDDYLLERRHLALMSVGTYALTVVLLETVIYKVYRRSSTGLDYTRPFTPDLNRLFFKSLGFYLTIAVLAGAFFLFELYRRSFFAECHALLNDFAPWWWCFVGVQVVYFYFVDGHQRHPKDSYWMFGKMLTGQFDVYEREVFKQHVLGWIVKGFFLPIMFVYLVRNFHNLNPSVLLSGNFISFYDFTFTAMFTVDLLITVTGYMMTFRIFDSHIRSSEPTALGWMVACIGYYPFWDTIYNAYLPYNDGFYWGHLFSQSFVVSVPIAWGTGMMELRPLQVLWGMTNVSLILVYIWATLAFGVRFSNLTHRGILTNGPYRWCKHPAYVSKNLSWWMISIPFFPHENFTQSTRHCAMLLLVNVIYFIRARTEERHLSRDPDYVAYALWMNEHSMFAWLGRLIPFFRYRPPVDADQRPNAAKV